MSDEYRLILDIILAVFAIFAAIFYLRTRRRRKKKAAPPVRPPAPANPERRPDVGFAGARPTARVRARTLVGCAGPRRRTIGGPRAVWPRALLGCTASA